MQRGVRGGVGVGPSAGMSVSVQIWCHRLAVAESEGSRRSRRGFEHVPAADLENQAPSEKI